MNRIIFAVLFSLLTSASSWAGNLKQKVYDEIQLIFPEVSLAAQPMVLNGQYINTPTEYGQNCQIHIDFTSPGQEIITLTGDYTPATSIGDGIYFNEPEHTLTGVNATISTESRSLEVSQTISDSLSTGTQTSMKITRNRNQVEVLLRQTNRFLLIGYTITKHCSAVFPQE